MEQMYIGMGLGFVIGGAVIAIVALVVGKFKSMERYVEERLQVVYQDMESEKKSLIDLISTNQRNIEDETNNIRRDIDSKLDKHNSKYHKE